MDAWTVEAAEALREQAAACRKLAARVRTEAGSSALWGLARQFDEEARRMNPGSEQR